MTKKRKKVVLVIMDGWGIAPPDKFNAIDNAKTPNFDRLIREYPNTSLKTDGESVGLSEGQFGTSEINHLTIGSGRVIWQELPKIDKDIETGEFFTNTALLQTINHVVKNKSTLHLMGILSDGGVHSHIRHLFAILEMLDRLSFNYPISLHIYADGRDVAPKSITKYMKMLEKEISKRNKLKITISTLQGRVFLDRDRDWEKTDKAFQLLFKGTGNEIESWSSAVNLEYNRNQTDEYFEQYVLNKKHLLSTNDGLIMTHFRTDRQYQIIKRILQEDIPNFEITSFVKASEEFETLKIAFPRDDVSGTLAEVISENGLKQLHVTETEKFPHLTYFLNGQRETELPKETWKMFESNRYVKPKYALEPTMRNYKIAQEVTNAIIHDTYDFIVANLSSPDMVGHTGNYHAAVVSAESVDHCLSKIYESIKDKLDDYVLMVTADHGNSEIMWDYKNDQPHTQHTLSKVPFIMVGNMNVELERGVSLIDIAPTILELLGLVKSTGMTGNSLIRD